MTSRKTNIPPLLEPYLHAPPEASLLLLTGVLNATPHWLTTRVLRGAYGESGRNNARSRHVEGEETGTEEDVAVVLVSWMRKWDFWKGEARRGAALDLARLAQEDKFAFVDGLTDLLSPSFSTLSSPQSIPARNAPPQRPIPTSPVPQRSPLPNRTLPTRSAGPLPSRGPPSSTTASPAPSTAPIPHSATSTQKNLYTLTNPTLSHAHQTITSAIKALTRQTTTNRRILLILDSPTTPLALSNPTDPSAPTATTLATMLLNLRSLVHATVLSLETDMPFLAPASLALQHQQSHNGDASAQEVRAPLETEMSRFIVGQAHVARWIVGVRPLDTGVARDVSGVIRVTRGGGWDAEDEEGDANDREEGVVDREIEVLYFVQGDGGVNVFERGGGQIG